MEAPVRRLRVYQLPGESCQFQPGPGFNSFQWEAALLQNYRFSNGSPCWQCKSLTESTIVELPTTMKSRPTKQQSASSSGPENTCLDVWLEGCCFSLSEVGKECYSTWAHNHLGETLALPQWDTECVAAYGLWVTILAGGWNRGFAFLLCYFKN